MHTINIVFQVFAIVSMYPVSSGFEEWIRPKERNFTGSDSYTRRAYLKYVIKIM